MKMLLTLLAQEYGLTVKDLVERGCPIEEIEVEQPDGTRKPAKETNE